MPKHVLKLGIINTFPDQDLLSSENISRYREIVRIVNYNLVVLF